MTHTADRAEIAQLLFMSFKRMHRLIDAELAEQGLSLSRAKILMALETGGPANQSTLAVAFDLAPRTVTELVDLLQRDGLVERRTDPADRRARQIHLTAAGREAHTRAQRTRSDVMNRVFGTLDDEELATLAATLKKIDHEVLLACARPDGPGPCGPGLT